jgi:ribonuclease J
MAYYRHKYLKTKPGDVLVLSSRFIPGNEKAINQIINEFVRRGAEVRYEKLNRVHVSGHACREELQSLLRLVRPRYFVPIHGEYRHLAHHAKLALEEGIPAERVLLAQDGDVIEFGEEGGAIVDRVETRRVYVHGKGVGDVGSEVLRERRIMSEMGLVTVVLAVSAADGKVISGPEISSKGVTYEPEEQELILGLRDAVCERVGELSFGDTNARESAKEEIRLTVRRYLNRLLGRKPMVQTIIMTA